VAAVPSGLGLTPLKIIKIMVVEHLTEHKNIFRLSRPVYNNIFVSAINKYMRAIFMQHTQKKKILENALN
jgi:2-polyprenyl-3-methyl-5-hydroxy-6-metoxy-1,4-benzoquinol methylase